MKPTWFDEHFENMFPEDETYNYAPTEIATRLQKSRGFVYCALQNLHLEGIKTGSWIIPKKAVYHWLLERASLLN